MQYYIWPLSICLHVIQTPHETVRIRDQSLRTEDATASELRHLQLTLHSVMCTPNSYLDHYMHILHSDRNRPVTLPLIAGMTDHLLF
jgi:hypothetical protein